MRINANKGKTESECAIRVIRGQFFPSVCAGGGSVLSVSLYETFFADLRRPFAGFDAALCGGQTFQLPAASEERPDGRLFRDEGGRSVSRPRERRFRSDQEMDRGGEQTDFRLPRDDPGTDEDQREADGAVELREV